MTHTMCSTLGRLLLVEEEIPLQFDARFSMASNTKPVIVKAVLILVEEGKIALDDTVGKYLPAFAEDFSDGITIHQFFTHTSGMMGRIFMTPLLEETFRQVKNG